MKTETLKNVIGIVGKIVAIGTLLTLPRVLKDETTEAVDIRPVSYYDAVRVISASSMFASDKRACIAAMKRDAGSDYYRAVIEIASGSMFGSDKIAMIKEL